MKRTLLFFAAACLSAPLFSQQSACKQDTIHFYQNNYRGKLTWQVSENGMDWSSIESSHSDTVMVVATGPAYYRTEVIEGLCKPYYSDFIYLTIRESPTVTLELRDSTCQNDTPFPLIGGMPRGGTYWGNGVIDGKFMPSLAGEGQHKVFYRYQDELTGCADTASGFIRVSSVPNRAAAGNDMPFVAADSVLLDGNTPENGTGTWTLVSGSNGHFSDIHSPKSWFIKDSNSLDFTLRWSINGTCGNSSDEVAVKFFPLSKNPCPNAPIVTDADGNVYPTVLIGTQCWMAKNLNVGRFVTSTTSIVPQSNLSNNNLIEKYCYNNNIENCTLYGGLYDWNEAMGYTGGENAQGICPQGWHIPGYNDWVNLNNFFKTFTAGEELKAGKSSGFDGYFAGDRHAMGEFYSFEASGFWWESNTYSYETINEGYLREIEACNGNLTRTHFEKKTGISVRCIKNN
ncbi:MAG: FISUMP domain-containing protein [Bacteroidales bacterium]|jgi:uncharacterized protein (TIGR02145 family)